ncbi:MAG TPA: YciI family protein, partial [Aeromicrobium sp.]|nr:YciI family protein [Aeromicrobium sp.]
MAHYLLSVLSTTADYVDVDYDDPKIQKMFADTNAFNEQLQADGHWVYANGLTNISDATVVDNTAGDVTVTDGPYAETKEFLGGFWIVDAA